MTSPSQPQPLTWADFRTILRHPSLDPSEAFCQWLMYNLGHPDAVYEFKPSAAFGPPRKGYYTRGEENLGYSGLTSRGTELNQLGFCLAKFRKPVSLTEPLLIWAMLPGLPLDWERNHNKLERRQQLMVEAMLDTSIGQIRAELQAMGLARNVVEIANPRDAPTPSIRI